MKIKYIGKTKINSYEKEDFTNCKEYNVLADYRNRASGQKVADNGLVVQNDNNENVMIFLNENKFVITDNEIKDTFVFNYSK